MSKVYWDTMLFIYLLEDSEQYGDRVATIYEAMRERGDILCASMFTLAELLVAPRKVGDPAWEQRIIDFFNGGDVRILPFDLGAAKQFGSIRAADKISPADAYHLACAASAGVDLYLTNDAVVRKAQVIGVHFIDSVNTSLYGGEVV